MRSVSKKILIFIIVICGLWYAMKGKAAELKGININEIGLAYT